jgi:hypothetical protein
VLYVQLAERKHERTKAGHSLSAVFSSKFMLCRLMLKVADRIRSIYNELKVIYCYGNSEQSTNSEMIRLRLTCTGHSPSATSIPVQFLPKLGKSETSIAIGIVSTSRLLNYQVCIDAALKLII